MKETMNFFPANIMFVAGTEVAKGLNRMGDYYRNHYGEERDSYRLKKLLTVAKSVLDYAQHKRFENREAVQTLQDALNNEINDVENVLEEFSAEQALKETLEAESGIITEELRSLLPARKNPISLLGNDKIKSKIKVITQKMDELANKIYVLGLEEAAAGSPTTGIQTSSVPQNSVTLTVDNSRLRISTGANLKVYLMWFYVIINPLLEIGALVMDQLSSPSKSGFALAGLVISSAVAVVCVIEFSWKVRKRELTWSRRGWIDFCGVLFSICQVISSVIQFVYFHQHAENPFKISIIPVIFAIFVSLSKSIKTPNDILNEGHSLVDHGGEELAVRENQGEGESPTRANQELELSGIVTS